MRPDWKTLIIFALAAACWRATPGLAHERIWLDAKINGRRAKLCLDSGSSFLVLCPQALLKFHLKFVPDPTTDFPAWLRPGYTEEYTLRLEGANCRTKFFVLNLPKYVDVDNDGLVGWLVMSDNILQIEADARKVTALRKVPKRATQWARFSVLTNLDTLNLALPNSEGKNALLCIDTGSLNGVDLPARKWRAWRKSHPETPRTLRMDFIGDSGPSLREEAWADEIAFGPVALTGVPIEQMAPAQETRLGADCEAVLGLAALKCVDLIVNAPNGQAYLQARKGHPRPYPHNRLGAVFVPSAVDTNKPIALAVEGSPACQAGIRNGDRLLQVDNVPVRGWDDHWVSRFRSPAGTKLELALERDGTNFTTTAILREIVAPAAIKFK